jgi:hypothetical protein
MTGRWSRGDRTHPGRVWSFIGEVARLAKRAEKDQTLAPWLHRRVRSPFEQRWFHAIGHPESGVC